MKKLNFSALKEKIKFYPTKAQSHILQNMDRFTIVASSKRLGKSLTAAYLGLRELFMPRHVIWIIGPNYELASRPWDYVAEWIDLYFEGDKGPFRINRHDRIIENTTTGAKLWLKSTDVPTSLLGKGLDLAILDEAARIDNGIWNGYIEPNLMDKEGRAFIISNPYGFNWFYDLYLKGLPENKGQNPGYMSFHFPTAIENSVGEIIGTNNPHAAKVEELKRIKKDIPKDVWTAEYLGEFREGSGVVFKGWEKCIDRTIKMNDPEDWFEDPINGHLYFVGVDIAQLEDFTVITVLDRMTHRLVGFWRGNGYSWEYIKNKVKNISERFNIAQLTVDATGNAGDMFVENLMQSGVNVNTQFKYTNKSKMMLIDKLSMFLERGGIKFPDIPQLVSELTSFTYKLTDSGNIKYGSHKKDDCINSLALACWNLTDDPLGDLVGQEIWFPRQRSYK